MQTPNFIKFASLLKERIDSFTPQIISKDPPELKNLLKRKKFLFA
jgi:hypothetical protein